MSLSAADFELAMAQLLPRGRVWETLQEETSTLLTALAQEFARLVEAAELSLEEALPDNDNTDLDHWERIVGAPEEVLTDAERLARIRTLLFGRRHVNRAYLEQLMQSLSDDPGTVLLNRAYPIAEVGVMGAGDSLAAGEWESTWLCEYMRGALVAGPDEFTLWSGFGAIAPDSQNSPVSLEMTAATVTLPAAPSRAGVDMDTDIAVDLAAAFGSVWIYPLTDFTLHIGFLRRDNTESVQVLDLSAGVWHRVETTYSVGLGSGSTTPRFILSSASGTPSCYISWAVAGIRNEPLEARMREYFPIHTSGHFAVQNEYSVILGQDQEEVAL